MTVTQTHKHSELHRGFVPEDQLADGTPTAGYAVLATGTGEAEWGPVSGGGGSCDCCFEPHTERFDAAGGTPETFTLTDAALYGVRVWVNGVRADPLDVTDGATSVILTTVAADVVIIDYERECGAGEARILFPGDNESHEYDGSPFDMNIIGHVTAEQPGYLVIRGTMTTGNPNLIVGTDAFPGSTYDVEGQYDSTAGPPTFPNATDEYMFRLEWPGEYWIAGAMNPYDPALTGSLTMDIHYPDLGGTALASPGTDLTLFGSYHVNLVATVAASDPTTILITLNSALPAGYGLYIISADETVTYQWDSFGIANPPLDPVPAGTYPYVLNDDDTHPGNWYVFIDNTGGYHGALSVDGEYETHLP